MILTLFDRNEKMCEAWEREFQKIENVKILHTDLENLPGHEYLVTAGNSYAIMDGGIDLAVRNKFGIELQDRVQYEAARRFKGCIPVGSYVCVDMWKTDFYYLIYAPTMELPMAIPQSNIYAAMSAIIRDFKNAKSIACCGLGTLSGRVPLDVAARVMKEAYLDNIL